MSKHNTFSHYKAPRFEYMNEMHPSHADFSCFTLGASRTQKFLFPEKGDFQSQHY